MMATSGIAPHANCQAVSESSSTSWRARSRLAYTTLAAHEIPATIAIASAASDPPSSGATTKISPTAASASAAQRAPWIRSPRNGHASSATQNGIV